MNYKNRNKYIKKYLLNKDIKYKKYINTKKIDIFNNKWWKINNNNNIIKTSTTSPSIDIQSKPKDNYIITYQKTLINDKEIRSIINKSNNILPSILKNNNSLYGSYNLYYKYQPTINYYIKR